jgi:hypothetical protein
MTRNTGLKTLFYNSFYLWLFKRHLISDKSETRGWCSCISSELIPGNHSKSQSQIRGFPLSKNSGWPAIKLSLVNRWRSQSEMLVTHSLLLEPFYCIYETVLKRIYNPITEMVFFAMFTFQLDNIKR